MRAELESLGSLGSRVAPVRLARQRRLEVAGELGAVLVDGVQRGSVVTVGGAVGAGVTKAALQLAAAVTATGEWVAFVDPGSLGLAAAAELGVVLERCVVVRGVDERRWPVVVGALLDGMTMVVAPVPTRLALGDARRLLARVRERQAVLVALEAVPVSRVGTWPAEAALRVEVHDARWDGLEAGGGLLTTGSARVSVEGRGAPRVAHLGLARAG